MLIVPKKPKWGDNYCGPYAIASLVGLSMQKLCRKAGVRITGIYKDGTFPAEIDALIKAAGLKMRKCKGGQTVAKICKPGKRGLIMIPSIHGINAGIHLIAFDGTQIACSRLSKVCRVRRYDWRNQKALTVWQERKVKGL